MGFAQPSVGRPRDAGGHGHTHGSIDPTIATTDRGIWAIKWSFVLLAITSVLQRVVVLFTGSVALLADTIHNVGDAVTAIPLWIAFRLARRKPSLRFTYGYGRVEDLAGVTIVLIILASAIVAGYQAIHRLLDPQPIAYLGWVAAAGIFGFIGNEAVAVFREACPAPCCSSHIQPCPLPGFRLAAHGPFRRRGPVQFEITETARDSVTA